VPPDLADLDGDGDAGEPLPPYSSTALTAVGTAPLVDLGAYERP